MTDLFLTLTVETLRDACLTRLATYGIMRGPAHCWFRSRGLL